MKRVSKFQIGLIVLFLLFCVRLIHIDADLPPFGVGWYYTADEGTYATLALNVQNFGDMKASSSMLGFTVANHMRTDMIGNGLTVLSMKLFGDNYFGFRLPNFLFVLGAIILLLATIYKIQKRSGMTAGKEMALLGIAAYLTCDFMLHNAAMVWEPTSHRMFFAMLALFFLLDLERKPVLKLYAMVCVTTVSILFVYVTNAFFALPCLVVGMVYISGLKGWKKRISILSGAILCVAVIYAVADIFYRTYWNCTYLDNVISIFSMFSDNASYELASKNGFLEQAIQRTWSFLASTEFLYNLPVFGLFLVQLPWGMRYLRQKRDYLYLFSFFSILGLWLQTIVTEDYIFRKSLLVYPFLIICIVIWLEQNDWSIAWQGKKRTGYFYYAVIAGLMVGIVYYRFYGIADLSNQDFSGGFRITLILFVLCPALLLLCLQFFQGTGGRLKCILCCGCFFACALFNLYQVYKYEWRDVTYTEKEMMVSMASDYGEEYLLGVYSMAYSLYNDIKPVCLAYEEFRSVLEQNPNICFLEMSDWTRAYIRGYLDNVIMEGSPFALQPIIEYDRNYYYLGTRMKVSIYRLADRKTVVDYYREKWAKEGTDGCAYEYYPDIDYPILGGIWEPVYVNINNDIYGRVHADVYGDINGNIYGDVVGTVHGTINGNVYGSVIGTVRDGIHGEVFGEDGTLTE